MLKVKIQKARKLESRDARHLDSEAAWRVAVWLTSCLAVGGRPAGQAPPPSVPSERTDNH